MVLVIDGYDDRHTQLFLKVLRYPLTVASVDKEELNSALLVFIVKAMLRDEVKVDVLHFEENLKADVGIVFNPKVSLILILNLNL